MLDGVGKVLERADGNGLLGRVLSGRVGLGGEGQHDLHVALGAERARLDERLVVVDAAAVHVDARVNVVQRVAHGVEALEELVVVDALGVRSDAVGVRLDAHVRIHLESSSGGHRRLAALDVVLAKQKLPIQVGLLDRIHVCDDELAAVSARAQAHHGHVLEVLAAERARAHHKVLARGHLELKRLAQHGYLRLVAEQLGFAHCEVAGVERRLHQRLLGQALATVEVHVLLDGRELARAGLHDLLGGRAADHRLHRTQLAARRVGKEPEHVVAHVGELVHVVVELVRERNELERVVGAPRPRQGAVVARRVLVGGDERQVSALHLLHLGEVGDEELGRADRRADRLEVDHAWLFHLLVSSQVKLKNTHSTITFHK